MKKVLFVISEVNKSLHFEWLGIQLKQHVEFSCILLGEEQTDMEAFLRSHNIPVVVIYYKSKKDFFPAWRQCHKVIRSQNPDTVHVHFWMAGLIGMSAAFWCGVKQRVLTRHHAMYHHNYFPKGVWLDRLINKMATHIIAPTQMVKQILTQHENVHPDKVTVINHGIDLNTFTQVDGQMVNQLKSKYAIRPSSFPVIGVISRYLELKGIHYIIPAFQKLLVAYPQAKLILANAKGDFTTEIHRLLSKLPNNSFIEIPYENEVAALYKLFDVFVHVPVHQHSESFGLIYLEALALGIPSVFTLSGVAGDFIEDRKNARVVQYCDAESIYNGITNIIENKVLRENIIKNGMESVSDFSIDSMVYKMITVYNKPS